MRITHVETFLVGTEWRNFTICRVHTDTGLTGLGESRIPNHPHALEAYAQAATRHIIGRDPFDIESLVMRMRRDDYSRPGEIMSSGIAIFEMACWDIVGKALQQPVYRLLGGQVRDRIRAYANGWYRVERTPEQFHAAARVVAARGYTALKFDPFGPGYYEIDAAERRRVVALCVTLSGPTWRSSSRCTGGSRPCRPCRSSSCSSPSVWAGSRSRCRRRTWPRCAACVSSCLA
jgi:galactonate dehydratase